VKHLVRSEGSNPGGLGEHPRQQPPEPSSVCGPFCRAAVLLAVKLRLHTKGCVHGPAAHKCIARWAWQPITEYRPHTRGRQPITEWKAIVGSGKPSLLGKNWRESSSVSASKPRAGSGFPHCGGRILLFLAAVIPARAHHPVADHHRLVQACANGRPPVAHHHLLVQACADGRPPWLRRRPQELSWWVLLLVSSLYWSRSQKRRDTETWIWMTCQQSIYRYHGSASTTQEKNTSQLG